MKNKKVPLDIFSESMAGLEKYNNANSETNTNERKKMIKSLKNIMDGELTKKQKICLIIL